MKQLWLSPKICLCLNVYGDINEKEDKMKKQIYIVISLSFAMTHFACADNSQESAHYTLPTIVIHYNKQGTQAHTSDLKATNPIAVELFPSYGNQIIDNMLKQNAWVETRISSGANPTYYLKGQRATVLLNGMSLNQFNSQAQNTSLVPANSIETIDINPTASSVLYGSMGLGGTIAIKQKFIDYNQYLIGMSTSYPLGGGVNLFVNQLLDQQKTWAFQLITNTESLDNYRDYSRNNNNNIDFTLLHQTNTQQLRFNFSDSYQYLHFPGGLSQLESDQDPWQASSSGRQKYINHTINSQLGLTQKINQEFIFNLQSQYQQQWANVIFANPGYGSSKQNSSLFYLRPSITYQNNWLKNITGSEFNYQTFKQSSTISDSRQTNVAIFNQADLKLNLKWQTGVGGRYEHSYTQGDLILSASHGSQIINIGAGELYLQYNWATSFNTRASISYAYQLPFIDQSNLTPGLTSNFGLDPQTAWIYQIDNQYKNNKLELKNSTYWMLINNQIAYNGNDPSSSFGANINFPPTQTIGNLFSLDYRWSQMLSSGGSFVLNLNTFRFGTFSHANNIKTDISNNTVPGQSPFSAEIHGNWHLMPDLTLWLQQQYFSAQYADGDYSNTLAKQSGYFLTNLGAKYQINQWQFNLSIYNLFNKFYYSYVATADFKRLSYYPANGITAMLNIQYTFS